MKLVKAKNNNLCDNGACSNRAEYMVLREDTELSNSLNLCSDCIKALRDMFYSEIAPKAVTNLIHKAEKRKLKSISGEGV